jgi:hypothetical protein
MYDPMREELEIEYWSQFDYIAELTAEHEDKFPDVMDDEEELAFQASKCEAHVIDYYMKDSRTFPDYGDDDIPF